MGQHKIETEHLESARLAEELAAARNEITALKEQLRQQSEMTFDGKVWWKVGADAKRKGPFCPTCYGKDDKQIPMSEEGDDHQCPVCKRWAKFRPTASYGEAPEGPDGDLMKKVF